MSSKNSNSSRDITWDYARGVAIFMIVLHHFIPNPLTSYPEQIKPHQETHHRIICAGRLNYQKGFDLLIESFALIADQCPEWHIDIFGSGDEENNLRSLLAQKILKVESLYILPQIIFLKNFKIATSLSLVLVLKDGDWY